MEPQEKEKHSRFILCALISYIILRIEGRMKQHIKLHTHGEEEREGGKEKGRETETERN